MLISVKGLQNLVDYFQLTSPIQSTVPFELKGVICILQNEIPCESLVTEKCQIPKMKNSIGTINGLISLFYVSYISHVTVAILTVSGHVHTLCAYFS